jgi:hypothetical protein
MHDDQICSARWMWGWGSTCWIVQRCVRSELGEGEGEMEVLRERESESERKRGGESEKEGAGGNGI